MRFASVKGTSYPRPLVMGNKKRIEVSNRIQRNNDNNLSTEILSTVTLVTYFITLCTVGKKEVGKPTNVTSTY